MFDYINKKKSNVKEKHFQKMHKSSEDGNFKELRISLLKHNDTQVESNPKQSHCSLI